MPQSPIQKIEIPITCQGRDFRDKPTLDFKDWVDVHVTVEGPYNNLGIDVHPYDCPHLAPHEIEMARCKCTASHRDGVRKDEVLCPYVVDLPNGLDKLFILSHLDYRHPPRE